MISLTQEEGGVLFVNRACADMPNLVTVIVGVIQSLYDFNTGNDARFGSNAAAGCTIIGSETVGLWVRGPNYAGPALPRHGHMGRWCVWGGIIIFLFPSSGSVGSSLCSSVARVGHRVGLDPPPEGSRPPTTSL